MTPKKIAFFGTPAFTTHFLDALTQAGFAPSLVVTAPDRPVGRGMLLTAPGPKVWAEAKGIKVLQPEKLDDAFFTELFQTHWDLFVVVAYGEIIPQRVIDLSKFGTINVHYSLLPKYRGATPTESAILNGDTITGVTIQQMVYKLDAGDILNTREGPIAPDDTTPTLRDKLNAEALTLLPETMKQIFDNTIIRTAQDESLATTCGKFSKEMGELDLTDDGITNDRKYRAYAGSIGTYFFRDGKRIKITKAHLDGETFVIDEVIPENGKRMPWRD
ncbi:methionyl-tRNA formyltransferase [Candidatus Nomurabacteria bacterium]|nr:methionyl-tRNA formyltransferase [Candidatus Nomurabacteria bacterium]